MSSLDWFLFFIYLTLTAVIGFWAGRRQTTTEDYFLGARRIPWWAAMLSLIATETSAVTVVAIPAQIYAQGGNFGFLQCAVGFAIGKVLISMFILPAYFKRKLTTPYEFLGDRLGGSGQRAGALLFSTALFVGAAFRVYVGAIPLSQAAGMSIHVSLIIIVVLAVGYTLMGGLKAVIYTDVFQMLLFLVGGMVAFGFILYQLPHGWESFAEGSRAAGKTGLIDSGFRTTASGSWYYDWSAPYTLFAGLIGSAFVTLATHGTDHSNLQRLLACRSLRSARAALLFSAVIVIFQFALFLAVGAAVYVFFHSVEPAPALDNLNAVLPYYIVHYLPVGLAGVLIAGIFAAAMYTVDSALSALSASTLKDWFPNFSKGADSGSELAQARWVVLGWGMLLWIGAEAASRLGRDDLIGAIFTVANSLYGPLLGIFLIALLLYRNQDPTTREGKLLRFLLRIGIPSAVGLSVQLCFFLLGREWIMGDRTFKLAWPWVTLVGALATFLPALVLKPWARTRIENRTGTDRE